MGASADEDVRAPWAWKDALLMLRTITDFPPRRNRERLRSSRAAGRDRPVATDMRHSPGMIRPRMAVFPASGAAAPIAGSPRPWTRGALATLCLLLAAHVALIAWVVVGLFPENPYNPVEAVSLRQVVTIAAAVLVGLALAARRHPVNAVSLAVLATAAALLLPGVVLTTGWILLDAWLVGDALLRAVARAGSEGPVDADPALCMLAGLTAMIGLLAATAAMRVHYAGAYAALLALPLPLALARGRAVVARAARFVDESPPWGLAERAALGVLGTVLVVHVFTVAKPEVGYDAQTMHLQFVRMLAAQHAWHFDVSRFAWAVMPLGADWMFALADTLAGEGCARFLNLCFGVMAGWLLFRLVRMAAPRLSALVSVALFASAPLCFLVTGSLFSETLWCAFLLGTLVAALAWLRSRAPADFAALLLCCAGALQCKAISLLWLAPLGLALLVLARGDVLRLSSWRLRMLALVALTIGAWPYANAAWRTGNPLFPFFNGLFRSPLINAGGSFSNATYHTALLPWTPYALVTDSARYLEGFPGAPGFHWLLLLPLTALVMARRRFGRLQWGVVALGVAFFVAVYVQQAYLRYLLPAFLLAAAAGGWALADLPDRRATRVAVGVAACLLIALNLRFMYTASWYQASCAAAAPSTRRRAANTSFATRRCASSPTG